MSNREKPVRTHLLTQFRVCFTCYPVTKVTSEGREESLECYIIVMTGRCINKPQACSNKPNIKVVTTIENAWSTRKVRKKVSMCFKFLSLLLIKKCMSQSTVAIFDLMTFPFAHD